MSKITVFFEIMDLMDKALIRGANHFSLEHAAALRAEKARWMEMGGSRGDEEIIDQFLTATRMAHGMPDEQARRWTDRAMEMKSAWRNTGAPEQADSPQPPEG